MMSRHKTTPYNVERKTVRMEERSGVSPCAVVACVPIVMYRPTGVLPVSLPQTWSLGWPLRKYPVFTWANIPTHLCSALRLSLITGQNDAGQTKSNRSNSSRTIEMKVVATLSSMHMKQTANQVRLAVNASPG